MPKIYTFRHHFGSRNNPPHSHNGWNPKVFSILTRMRKMSSKQAQRLKDYPTRDKHRSCFLSNNEDKHLQRDRHLNVGLIFIVRNCCTLTAPLQTKHFLHCARPLNFHSLKCKKYPPISIKGESGFNYLLYHFQETMRPSFSFT